MIGCRCRWIKIIKILLPSFKISVRAVDFFSVDEMDIKAIVVLLG